jgi:serine/threonine-protein kinase
MNKGVSWVGSNACPAREELLAFHRGALSAPDLERLADHLAGCDSCAAALAELSEPGLLSGLRQSPGVLLLEEPEYQLLEARARDIDVEAMGPPTVDIAATSPQHGGPTAGPPLGVFGRYELLEKVGEGGMGVVYRARQKPIDLVVALKMLPAGASAEAKTRFLVEGKAVARLRHPGVVQIHELGEHQGRLYLAMEYVEGGTLARRLGRGPLGVSAAAELAAALARAVQAAHAAGVIHRDLKPSNVLLTPDGAPKVADFGLAKLLDDVSGVHTQTHAVVGTAQYMAPEQAAGKVKAVGRLADVHALGSILYECLTGRPPFVADSRSKVLELVQKAQPQRPARLREGLSRDLEAVCLKCLEKEPRRRYASAGELADDLDRWLRGEPTRARPEGPVRRLWRFLRRNTRLAVLLLAAGLGLGLGASLYFSSARRHARTQEAALARGEAVTLIGARGGPRWSRWDSGAEGSQTEVAADGTFTVHSQRKGLLTLVRDPGVEHYRLQAQVRHEQAGLVPDVGLFFALREYTTSQGKILLYGQLSFDDVSDPWDGWRRLVAAGQLPAANPPPPRMTTARLFPHLHPLLHEGPNTYDARGEGTRSTPFEPEMTAKGRWRTLAVEVTPEWIRGTWEGTPLEPLASAAFVAHMRDSFQLNAQHPAGDVILREVAPEFVPRGPLGLLVIRGSASFCNVRIEPIVGPD